jgi:hypothetical protein
LHTVRVSAPGKKPWSASVQIGAMADQQSLVIPALAAAPPEAVAPAKVEPAFIGPSATPDDELQTRPVPTSVYLAGGITLAFAAGASVSGLAYLQKREDYHERERESDAVSRRESALRYGYLNAGLWVATAIGAGVTTYLYVTRPARATSASARVLPWASPDGGGLSVSGGF